MRSALIRTADGVVDNVIMPSDEYVVPDGYIMVATDEAGVDWTYAEGVFTPPVAVETENVEPRIMSSLAFIARFTDPEVVSITSAAMSNVTVAIFWNYVLASDDISLDDETIIAGVEMLEPTIIGSDRVDLILGR